MTVIKKFEFGQAPWFFQYIWNHLIICSQIGSVILGGDPDETISSRTGKAAVANKWWFKKVQMPVIDFLLGKNHCYNSIEPDEGKKQIWDWAK